MLLFSCYCLWSEVRVSGYFQMSTSEYIYKRDGNIGHLIINFNALLKYSHAGMYS